MSKRVNVALSWKTDAEQIDTETTLLIKQRLEEAFSAVLETLVTKPSPNSLKLQLSITPAKKKKGNKRIIELPLDETLKELKEHVDNKSGRKIFQVSDKVYSIRTSVDRYQVISENRNCVVCGLEAQLCYLEVDCKDKPFINIYGMESGKHVLFTKDHILAKSKGGKNQHENYQTMCSICNNLKSNQSIDIEVLRAMRQAYIKHHFSMSKKALRKLINKVKAEALAAKVGEDGPDRQTGPDSASQPVESPIGADTLSHPAVVDISVTQSSNTESIGQ